MEAAAIDFETTGYENGKSNDPWQLGIAIIRDGVICETKEFFFGTEQTPDYESIFAQWEQFFPYLQGRTLIAHNIATERTILTRLAPLTKWAGWIDTLRLAKARYPKLDNYQLGALCERFNLVREFENRTWHDGLFDAIHCARLALFLGI